MTNQLLKIGGEHKNLSKGREGRGCIFFFRHIFDFSWEGVADSLLSFDFVCFSLSIFLGRVQEESGCLMVLLKLMSPGVRKLLL